ncbi:Hypothetical predicted protein [Mytilus galloprovincialis]|uniref:ZMYM2-like/QRICH1 C-terminal domain-containing protein n=1 Tax=Mytilus galloprovincialis TaxID=29158 RepID=A0A8B6FMD5_MYTGA|nr:Hypothetical predicted protein [Mytilus galloprovincialis]
MANNDGDGARFVAVGDGETGDFVELMKNANTRKKTVSDIKILKDWLTSNPEALTNTVWLNNSLHFGMRSRQEHTDMLFGDVTMKATSEGKHYLEYSERMTKTRQGESGNTRSFAPKMFENPGDPRCPVNAFKEFMKRRPVDTLTPDSRIYLSTLHNITPDSTFPPIRALWFSKQPLGKNKLGDLAKTMFFKAGLTGPAARKNVKHLLSDISSGNRGSIANKPGNVSNQPSTSTHNIEQLTDDDLTNVDVDAMVACIENYEENSATMAASNSAQPTVIDLAPIMPNSRLCVLPYSKISGNVTINFYGVNDKN